MKYKKAFMFMMYKVSMYRKIPDFAMNLVSHIPLPSFKSNDVLTNPSIESTMDKVINIPLTPLTIVTGVQYSTIGLLKASI